MLDATTEPWYALPEHPVSRHSAVIIGAGLAGAAVAYSLARRNWRVTLIDRHETPAQEASGIAAGMISPRSSAWHTADGGFYLRAYHYLLGLLPELAVSVAQCGVLQLPRATDQQRLVRLAQSAALHQGIAQWLEADQASDLSGIRLRHGGLFYPQAGWLNPLELCTALTQSDQITTLFAHEVIELKQQQRQWSVQNSHGKQLARAEVVVVANGRAANSFKETQWLPLVKIRGQTSQAAATPATRQLRIVLCQHGYVTPASNDRHIFGATFQRDRLTTELRAEDNDANLRRIRSFAPRLAQQLALTVSAQHAALRVATTDRLPVVGGIPDRPAFARDYAGLGHNQRGQHYPPARYLPGLFISTGFATRGIVATPLAGELLAAMINREPPPLPAEIINALSPARFLIRRLRRRLNV